MRVRGGQHPQTVECRINFPPRPQSITNRALGEVRNLLQEAHRHASTRTNTAAVGVQVTGKNFQQSGLPGTIDAHDADAVTVRNSDGQITNQGAISALKSDVLKV